MGATRKLILPLLLFFSGAAGADWIVLNGVTHGDVYVREGRSMYFVHFPDTGVVMNVSKNSVAKEDIVIHHNETYRGTLLETWRENNPECSRDGDVRADVRQHQAQFRERTASVRPKSVPVVNPRVERLVLGVDAPPKIILRKPPLRVAAPAVGYGRNAPATAPRQLLQHPGAMPRNSVAGWGGAPGMMGGGMGGGIMGRDVTAISNLSDLFFNIDDRMVGEPPAEILPSYLFLRAGHTNRAINLRRGR